MIRTENLTQEERTSLETLLKKLKLLPPRNCQMILHCAQGTVQAVEYSQLKLK